jgi:hypothetical protein
MEELMSKKVVEIIQDGSYRAGQPSQVQVAEGNSIEFKNGQVGATELVLTPETRSILSPTPASTVVRIAAGASVSFDFKNPSSSNYCCQVLAEGTEPRPITCNSSGEGAVLSVLSSEERSTDTRTGRGL